MKAKLDNFLKELNDDYAVERNHALHDIIVDLIPNQLFLDFLKQKGKIGSQNKFPRVLKGELMNEWKAFITEHQAQVVASL